MRTRTPVMPSKPTAFLSAMLLVAGVLFPSIPTADGLNAGIAPPGNSTTVGGSKTVPETAVGIDVRVMTFNIRHGTDEDNDLDLESVADDIESAKAQIVGLQEVDRHRSARSDFVDQAKWLAHRLHMDFAFGLNRKTPPKKGHKKPGLHGVVVLSKFPILSARNHMLANIKYKHRPTKQRSMLEVVVDVNGTKISVYNTHLDHQRKEQRLAEMKEILAITGQSSRPSILVGDLNSQPFSRVVALAKTQFHDVMAELGEGEEPTFPYDEPDRRIDYILTRGPISARWAAVIDTDSSDHMPVVADLTIATPVEKPAGSPTRLQGGPKIVPHPPAAPRTGATPIWF